MPKIPEISYRTSPIGPVNAPRATAAEMGGAQAAGLQQLGRTVTATANTLDQIKDQQDQFQAGLQLTEDSQKAYAAFEDAKDAAPPGAPGFVDAVSKKFDEWIPAALNEGPANTRAQKMLQSGYAQLRSQITDKAIQFQAQAQTAETLRRTNDATDTMANIARADPTQKDAQLESAKRLLDTAPFVDEQTRAKSLLAIHDKIYSSAADGWTTQFETQPVTAKQLDDAITAVKRGDFGFRGNLDPRDFDNVLTRLENRRRQLKDDNKQAVLYAIKDEQAAIATNGRFTGRVTPKLLADTFPDNPDRAKRIWMDLQSEQRKYTIRLSRATTSFKEDTAYLSALKGGVRGEGAQFRREEFTEAQQVLAAKYRAWTADSVAYMLANDHSLAKAVQIADQTADPEAGKLVIAKKDAWYDRMETPTWAREYLGKGAAQQMVAKLNGIPAEQASNELYEQQRLYPGKYQQIMRELGNAGLDPAFMVLGRMDNPQEAVGRKNLAEALQVGRSDLIKSIGSMAKSDIDAKVLTKMSDFNSTMGFAGTQGGRIISAETTALQNLSYKIFRDKGGSAADAVNTAYKQLHNTRDYEGTYSVPKVTGVDMPSMVNDAKRQVLSNLKPEMFAPAAIPPEATATDRAMWESPEGIKRRQQAVFDVAKDQGVWVNSPDGGGIIRMAPDDSSKTGYSPVRDKNGNYIEIRYNDVLEHPAPTRWQSLMSMVNSGTTEKAPPTAQQ